MINSSHFNSTFSPIHTDNPASEPTPSVTEPHSTGRKKRGVAAIGKLWPQRTPLTITFMDMSKKDQDLITKAIKQWEPHINLKLKFVPGPYADIRISGSPHIEGDWSALGTDARFEEYDAPTMHFDLRNKTEEMLERIALHEFGHALGLVHEHKHPDRTLSFNTPTVYKAYKNQLGWPNNTIREEVLKKALPKDVITSSYDPSSIMHYNFPDSLLWQQSGIPINYGLSYGDKNFISSIYPGRQKGER